MPSHVRAPVIVDAMGGDHAPHEIVAGAIGASREFDLEIVLVGQPELLGGYSFEDLPIRVEPAAEVIAMGEHPARALRRKPNASIRVAVNLLKKTPEASLVSAGPTGAVMAAALLDLGRIEGIERPAIAAMVPTLGTPTVVLDVGANVECRPSQLVQFGLMGAEYARFVLGIASPRVGLLNIGEEETKGTEVCQATHALLRDSGLDFVGNVEPGHVFEGRADVVVCDGFTGNIFLKSCEGVSRTMSRLVEAGTSDLPPPIRERLAARLDRFQTTNPAHAGAPLLGVDGPLIVAHGAARAETMKHAIRLAHRFASSGAVGSIRRTVHGRLDREVQTAV